MIHSMTGFAAQQDAKDGVSWTVEIRGVNAKGLDIRVRAPDRMQGFDQQLKALFQKSLTRGNVTVSVRMEHDSAAGAMRLDPGVLGSFLAAAKEAQMQAERAGLSMRPASVIDLLGLRGVMSAGEEAEVMPEPAAVTRTAQAALNAFIEMRAGEGTALAGVLADMLRKAEVLTRQAAALAEARKDDIAATLRSNLAKVLDNADGVDETRVAQELALLAVKADVTEEIDRLHAHVAAARTLLSDGGAVGRKLDFLMQEFNREANTLCSKSGSTDLTRVGLDLKAVIDQMREQVQNVE